MESLKNKYLFVFAVLILLGISGFLSRILSTNYKLVENDCIYGLSFPYILLVSLCVVIAAVAFDEMPSDFLTLWHFLIGFVFCLFHGWRHIESYYFNDVTLYVIDILTALVCFVFFIVKITEILYEKKRSQNLRRSRSRSRSSQGSRRLRSRSRSR